VFGIPRPNIPSNCATFQRSAYRLLNIQTTLTNTTKRPIALKGFANLWKWEATDAGSWESKIQKTQILKRSSSMFKV
jgi:hypothetical protein